MNIETGTVLWRVRADDYANHGPGTIQETSVSGEVVRVVCGYCDGEQVVRVDGCGGECAAGNLCPACAEPCVCVERVVMGLDVALEQEIAW